MPRVTFSDTSGGRNAIDPLGSPGLLPNQCRDAVNVDWWQSPFGHKRRGLNAHTTAFLFGGGPFTGKLSFLGRFMPGTDETIAELWAIDSAGVFGHKSAPAVAGFTQPVVTDALTGNAWEFSSASINGFFFLAYKSAQSRLHLWDGFSVRRAGINQGSSAPTVANTGAGAYPATLRYYRVRFYADIGGISRARMSEPTPSVSFTPSGAGAAARITRPTAPGEGELTWLVEASSDNVTFQEIQAVAIGTTTFDDTNAYPLAAAFTFSKATGTFTLQKSYRFIAADNGRLIGFGSFTSTDKQNDIEISAVIGSLDEGDVERVDTTLIYRYNLDENDSGEPTGLCGPDASGAFYALKTRQIWQLRSTGDPNSPYQRTKISNVLGAVRGKAYCMGEDASGNACLYVMTAQGLYRYGHSGLVYIGKGLEDYCVGPTEYLDLSASVVCHMTYHDEKKQVWIWITTTTSLATHTNSFPMRCFVYHVRTGGVSQMTGTKITQARCSVAWTYDGSGLGTTTQRRPYIGSDAANATLYQLDNDTQLDDDSTAFQALIRTQEFEPGGPGYTGACGDAVLSAPASSGVSISVTAIPDRHVGDAAYQQVGSVSLTPDTSEADIVRRAGGTAVNGTTVLYEVGDVSATTAVWKLSRLTVHTEQQEPV